MLSYPDIDTENPGWEPWKEGDPQNKSKDKAKPAGHLASPAAAAAAAAAAEEEELAVLEGRRKKVRPHCLHSRTH